jgi:hypothetical protein
MINMGSRKTDNINQTITISVWIETYIMQVISELGIV